MLGTRKAESSARARTMSKHEKERVRDRLSPNASLPNCLVYTPIEDWSNDDVWMYLMQVPNPWGYNNKDLLTMYQGLRPMGNALWWSIRLLRVVAIVVLGVGLYVGGKRQVDVGYDPKRRGKKNGCCRCSNCGMRSMLRMIGTCETFAG